MLSRYGYVLFISKWNMFLFVYLTLYDIDVCV